jgi:uncharacterized damage-inducible protein DinB
MKQIDLILTELDQAYDRRSWHGTNLKGSIRGLSAREAAWRPGPRRHCIQEIIVHAAYWKYVVRRRLSDEPRGSFPLDGSNWFPRARANQTEWRADVRLLEDSHKRLRATIAASDPRKLSKRIGSESWLSLVSGIIAHDLYHAGQIQLLKRMQSG